MALLRCTNYRLAAKNIYTYVEMTFLPISYNIMVDQAAISGPFLCQVGLQVLNTKIKQDLIHVRW